jgi:hypothetical protein
VRWILAVWVAALVSLLAPHAVASDRLVVVLRIVGDDDRALAARVRGQIADLEVDLLESESASLEANLAGQLEAADSVAKSRGARAVVWFDARGTSLLVLVAVPSDGRVLVRSIAIEGTAQSSATLESAALVVRSALRALAAGGTIGIERKDLEPEKPAANPAPAVETPKPTPPTPRATSNAPSAPSVHGFASLTIGAVFDGLDRYGAQSGALGGGLRLGPWSLGGRLGVTAPKTLASEYGSLVVSRYDAALRAGFDFVRLGDVSLSFCASVGVAAIRRGNEHPQSGVTIAEGRTHTGATLGADLAARLHPRGERFSFVLGAGADYLPAAPMFGYQVGGTFLAAHSASTVQPKLFLALEVSGP